MQHGAPLQRERAGSQPSVKGDGIRLKIEEEAVVQEFLDVERNLRAVENILHWDAPKICCRCFYGFLGSQSIEGTLQRRIGYSLEGLLWEHYTEYEPKRGAERPAVSRLRRDKFPTAARAPLDKER